ncbi:MAG: hypothetical protein CMH53_09820 [Myxococcales bacterium]|nr:hypothetical protein [Myxococcales bacterium]
MSNRANLDPMTLLSRAWATFQTRPKLLVPMTLLFGSVVTAQNWGDEGSGDDIALAKMIALAVGGLIFFVIKLSIAGPLRAGYDMALLRITKGDQSVEVGDFFAGFHKVVPLAILGLLHGSIITAGMLCLVVPGVVLALGLWPCYLLAMEQELSPIDALKAAWRLTQGHKLALFWLVIASFGAIVVGLLALVVGVFIAAPVVQLAWINAYEELRQASAADNQLQATL